MTPERAIASCSPRTNDMQPGVATTGARWSASDAALACGRYVHHGHVHELGERETFAFRYRWARDDSVRSSLRAYLLMEAVEVKAAEGWPEKVKRLDIATGQWQERRYLADLVDLALIEEHHWFTFKRLGLWPAWLGVYPTVWSRVLSPRYEAIRQLLDHWCGTARAHIARRLRDV